MLGECREYKTRARIAEVNLEIHFKYMTKYMLEGLSKEEASKKAFYLIKSGELDKEIKCLIKEKQRKDNQYKRR